MMNEYRKKQPQPNGIRRKVVQYISHANHELITSSTIQRKNNNNHNPTKYDYVKRMQKSGLPVGLRPQFGNGIAVPDAPPTANE